MSFICSGFNIMSNDHQHVLKPVSVQAMWSVVLLYFIVISTYTGVPMKIFSSCYNLVCIHVDDTI